MKLEDIILNILSAILTIIFIISTLVVGSKDLQTFFEADMTLMWVFGAIFGFFYIPMIKTYIKPYLHRNTGKHI